METEGKISLIVTFIQWFVKQSRLYLNFIKTLLFPHKRPYFSNNSYDLYKNADGNLKFWQHKIDFLKTTSNNRR